MTGVRRLAALVNGLPADAAAWREQQTQDEDELLPRHKMASTAELARLLRG